jgi:hypothetical protein
MLNILEIGLYLDLIPEKYKGSSHPTTPPIITKPENYIIPESELLYQAYLVPDKTELLQMGMNESIVDKMVYRVIDGGETPVKAAKPLWFDLIQYYEQNKDKNISPFIQQRLDSHDFYVLSLACTFRSHDDSPHPYIYGEMKFTLSNLTGNEDPIVFDICPSEVNDHATIKKEYGISPSFEFMEVKVSAGQIYRKAVTFTEITPIVTSFGKQLSKAGWEYRLSKSRQDLRGNKEGAIIIMVSKGDKIRVTVDVSANVKENLLAKIFPFSRMWKDTDFDQMRNKLHSNQTSIELPLSKAMPVTEEELTNKRWKKDFSEIMLSRKELTTDDKSFVLPYY